MTRRDDWRGRLAAELARQHREPFEWGKQDCAIGLACGVVEAITGVDLARGYRGKYRGPKAAVNLMREAGAHSLTEFVAGFLPQHGHPAQAQIGDIGIIPDPDSVLGEALCVVDTGTVIVMTDQGHGRRPRADMTAAFKVG